MFVIIIIALIILGNMINQRFLQYCATNPVSFGFMLAGYCFTAFLLSAIFVIAKKMLDAGKDEYKKHIDIENMDKEFINVYEKLKSEYADKLESLRKKVLIRDIGMYFGISLAFTVVFAMTVTLKGVTNETVKDFSSFCQFMPFIGAFIAILFGSWGERYSIEYVKIYKENILPNFIKFVNPNLTYSYEKHQKYKEYKGRLAYKSYEDRKEIEREYIDADFDGISFDYITEEDWVEGQIDENHFFKVTDIAVKQEYTDSDGDRRTRTMFEGLFYSLEADKDIGTCLKININKNNAIEGAENYQIQMDSSEFEDVFDVYCDDKILAVRILTADIMELIINFYKKYYIPFEICYRNNKIYTRFFVEDMFEPSRIKNSLDIKSLYMYFAIVEFSMEFSKKIIKIANDVEI